jgi:HSP20 family protein
MTVWDPFRSNELHRLRREMDHLFSGVAPHRGWPLGFLPGAGARQYPRVNLVETAEGFLAEALAPGVDPGSFDVSVKDNVLTISGEKVAPQEVASDAYHRTERSAGRFTRSLELPAEVDVDKVTAAYREGILLITLPKAPAARPRRIDIAVA